VAGDVTKNFADLVSKSEEAYSHRRQKSDIIIQIGSATCEHAAGSLDVLDEFRKHVAASGRSDIVIHKTGCTGRCSREPIISLFLPGQIPVKYELVDRKLVHEIFTSHVQEGKPLLDHVLDGPIDELVEYEVLCCRGKDCFLGDKPVSVESLTRILEDRGVSKHRVLVESANCFGVCTDNGRGNGAHLLVRPGNVLYRVAGQDDLEEIIDTHIVNGKVVDRLRVKEKTLGREFFEIYGDVAFLRRQTRIALRHNGVIDPESIDEFIHYRGFQALARTLAKNDRQWVVDQIRASKLRGRGGGGFSTGEKWEMGGDAPGDTKFIICNADEGDPGAFMDRSMLESDPFNVIEGIMIGAFTIGASQGFVYVRAEYPLAVARIQTAIDACRKIGLLGTNILGSGFDFDLEIRLGAGAFVCGEETALIHSIEGERGQPRIRPPYPTESGLWAKPTVINNVETFANISAIINFGPEWFAQIGSSVSGGTKVFALAGKVRHTGLVEVPMGVSLRDVVVDIGGGVVGGKQLKAIQTGGSAGGCIPERSLDTPVDFDTLKGVGSIMGSGGMIVLDEDDCMVDIAKFFVAFSQDESCGKCTPCREGTKRMLEILDRIVGGQGSTEDLELLERLGSLIKKSALCGLGRTAPHPALSTLKHFNEEYREHVIAKRCSAKRCVALLRYEVDKEKCIGCAACARLCPVACISGERKEPHTIDIVRCIKCGACFEACRFDAIRRI